MRRYNSEQTEELISPERYMDLKPDILLQKLGVPPGSTLLDLGCGNGFFTFPASAAMGENGMVIAADISPEMLLALNRRIPRDNVQILESQEVSLDIEDASVDGVVIITVFHEFKEASKNLAEIYRVLKPKGKLMILDWKPGSENTPNPKDAPKVFLDDAHSLVKDAGFDISEADSYTETTWLILASK